DEDTIPSEEDLILEDEAMEEEPQPVDYVVHALDDYSNPQTMKVGGLLKQQLITILIDMSSTNNFLCRLTVMVKGNTIRCSTGVKFEHQTEVRVMYEELTETSPEVNRGSDDVVGSSPRPHQRFAGKFVGSSP
ncbi:hypothetical protein GW17_00055469, partial [Ensete ventricosum]